MKTGWNIFMDISNYSKAGESEHIPQAHSTLEALVAGVN